MAASVVSRVAGLGALTAAGQLIVVGTLPAYSRVFDPGTYGEYVVFVGAFTVVSVLAGVRYESAIVLPRNPGIAALLTALVLLIALAVATLIVGATFAAEVLRLVPDTWAAVELHFGCALAAATMLGALQRCLGSWCVRSGRFLRMGWAQLVFCLVLVVAQLSFATVMNPLAALVWGYACAVGFQVLCLVGPGPRARFPLPTPAGALRGMRIAARKYRRFPTYMVGYALASSARDRLVQIVLGLGAGAAAVGRFGLAYRVTFAPNSLIYSAVSPVFYGIASRGNRLAVGRFAAGLVEATFVVLVVPYLAFAIEAPVLTDAVLSDKWRGTGPYLQALAAPALLLAATCWLDRAFDSFRRQHVALALEASFTTVAVIVVACLSKLTDPVSVTWAFGVLALGYYWIYFLFTFVACGFQLKGFRHACLIGLLTSGTALLLGLLVHRISEIAWRLPAYVAVMVSVIALWTWLLGGAANLRMLVQSRVGDSS
jgi:O-antigen/teichoic acid export membrane protein